MTSEQGPGPNLTNTTAGRAVFLSYASEDAPAAHRICAALRAAGIEVWFDQSELRGGDVWDATIRRQIRSCALFIPIISVNAHARTEGYFRLEWKLAVDRSHLLAPDQAFMLPVAIDQTPQTDERLPDRFRELQWTRLPEGATPPEFVARIRGLLGSAPPGAEPRLRATAVPGGASAAGGPPPSRGIKALWPVAVVVLLVLGAVALYRLLGPKPEGAMRAPAGAAAPAAPAATAEKSIAVLPFADESERKDQGYFSDGLSDELIDKLGRIPGLRVPARTSSFYFKDRQTMLPEIGRTLNVANVLEGSVRKSGSALRVSAEMIRISDDTRVWSETYDRKLDDIFKVQDDIAGAVVSALKVSVLGEATPRAAPTASTEAYLHYLRALEATVGGQDDTSPQILAELQQAVAIDPSFAQAWVLLATYRINAFTGAGQSSYESARRAAVDALQRALKINPDLAEAHVELARVYYMLDWNAPAAWPELERAQVLAPQTEAVLWLVGYIADSEGRFDQALADHKRLRELDPLFVDNYRQLGNACYRSGRLAEGAALLGDAVGRFPTATTIHYRLGLILLAQHKTDAALDEFRLEQQLGFRLLGPPLALDRLGRRAEADRMLAEALTVDTVVNGAAYQIALVYADRGDTDAAFRWLERAYRQRDAGMHWMKYDPLLQPLKSDPRFKALLAEMHQG